MNSDQLQHQNLYFLLRVKKKNQYELLLYGWSDGFVCNLSLCVCSFVQADGVQSAAADGVQTEYGQRWDQRHHHSWTGIRNSSGVCVCVCVCVCVWERETGMLGSTIQF